MSNLLVNPSNWGDPIWWNPDTDAYEILIESSAGTSWGGMSTPDGAPAGARIEFDYVCDAAVVNEGFTGRLELLESGTVLWFVDLTDLPISGHVNIECQEGAWYGFQLVRDDGWSVVLYDVDIVLTPTPDPPPPDTHTAYNCQCDDDYPRTTLQAMRNRLARRLGFAAQVSMGILPPGMADLLDDFVRQAQETLYRSYNVFRMERFYSWDMEPGVRFYDLDGNSDTCPRKLDPRKLTWVGISQGDDSWRPLVCGIDPVMYSSRGGGIPSHYEVRQCIEVWPAPADATWKLRVKGHFGLAPLEADDDETSIDPEAVFLLALANAKAHYGQPDAGNYASQASSYVRSLVAGSHHTRRYIPGRKERCAAVRPVPVGGWTEDP